MTVLTCDACKEYAVGNLGKGLANKSKMSFSCERLCVNAEQKKLSFGTVVYKCVYNKVY